MKPQDNPFAKGVSINQDIVMEEFTDGKRVRIAIVETIEPKSELIGDMMARVDHQRREMLALGREEE